MGATNCFKKLLLLLKLFLLPHTNTNTCGNSLYNIVRTSSESDLFLDIYFNSFYGDLKIYLIALQEATTHHTRQLKLYSILPKCTSSSSMLHPPPHHQILMRSSIPMLLTITLRILNINYFSYQPTIHHWRSSILF